MLKNLFWKRLLAGLFDYTALCALFQGVLSYFLDDSIALAALCALPFFFLVNALLLSVWKTTLGHALFGLQLTDPKGEKLSFLAACKSYFVKGSKPSLSSAWKTFFGKDQNFLWRNKPLKWPIRAIAAILIFFSISSLPVTGGMMEIRTALMQHVLMTGWVQYNSSEGRFSIHFPSKPKLSATEVPIEDTNQSLRINEFVSSPSKELSYTISYTDLPSKWTAYGSRLLLKETLKIMLENHPGLHLLNQEFNVYSGYRVLDYKALNGKEQIEGRLILVGNKLYRLTVAHPKDSSCEEQIQQFMSSLKI